MELLLFLMGLVANGAATIDDLKTVERVLLESALHRASPAKRAAAIVLLQNSRSAVSAKFGGHSAACFYSLAARRAATAKGKREAAYWLERAKAALVVLQDDVNAGRPCGCSRKDCEWRAAQLATRKWLAEHKVNLPKGRRKATK